MSSWISGHLRSILGSKDRANRDAGARRHAEPSDCSSHSAATRRAAEAILSSSPSSTGSGGVWPLHHAASPRTRKGEHGRKWIVGKQYAVVDDAVFFMCLRDYKKLSSLLQQQQDSDVEIDRFFIRIDDLLQYFPFCADFGPLSLACIHRFADLMTQAMARRADTCKKIVLCSSAEPKTRTNAACLVACWLILEHGYTAEEAWEPFHFEAGDEPAFLHFREASYDKHSFPLHVIDVLGGVVRAKKHGLIDLKAFDLEKYETYDHPSVADLHVVVPGVFAAFKGPKRVRRVDVEAGVADLTVDDLVPVFVEEGVSDVVRLNHKEYEEEALTRRGIAHHDIFFEDCSVPTAPVLQAWFEMCARRQGVVAVHCKAGLGRTGTLIATWLMRKYKFTGREAIGFLRVMRPGSILGPQQEFLVKNQELFWAMDDPDLYDETVMYEDCPPRLRQPLKPDADESAAKMVQGKHEAAPSSPATRASSGGSNASAASHQRPPLSKERSIPQPAQSLSLTQHLSRKSSWLESALSAKSTPKSTPPATPNIKVPGKGHYPAPLDNSGGEEDDDSLRGQEPCEGQITSEELWTEESLRVLRAQENTMAMCQRTKQRLLADSFSS